MVNYNLGELYFNNSNTKKAIEYYEKSLETAKQNNQVDFINDNYEALLNCYAKNGEYSKFNDYFRLFNIGKDTLIDKLHELELTKMEVKYKVEESIKESNELQKENQQQQQVIKKYKMLLAGIGTLLIIILFIYILFLRVKK